MHDKKTQQSSFEEISSKFQRYQNRVLKLLYDEFVENDEIIKYFKKALIYNTEKGKKIRGSLVVLTYSFYNSLETGDNLKDEAYLIGWAIEILQASFLVLDDIIDDSKVRRGKPSWFVHQQNEGYGLLGINDGMHLFICATKIIYKIFQNSMDKYSVICHDLVKLFTDISYKTCIGQGLDGISALLNLETNRENPKELFSKMNLSINRNIMLYKTSYYSFYLPIACGLILAGVKDNGVFSKAEEISIKLGVYFQTQDDYLDAFGDIKTLGKEGTDIKEGKCTWLICKALSLANEEQEKLLANNYGRSDRISIDIVKKVYRDLKLDQEYSCFETEVRTELFQLIDKNCRKCNSNEKSKHPSHLDPGIFLTPMKILFNRSK